MNLTLKARETLPGQQVIKYNNLQCTNKTYFSKYIFWTKRCLAWIRFQKKNKMLSHESHKKGELRIFSDFI